MSEDQPRPRLPSVTDYLEKVGLDADLDALGFQTVSYGCSTCNGDSRPLPDPGRDAIRSADIDAAPVLSGNRNLEGRVSPDVKVNYFASPPLVVAYAIAGSVDIDLENVPLGQDKDGNPIYPKDTWPTTKEVQAMIQVAFRSEMF